jgi:hypothetical protein
MKNQLFNKCPSDEVLKKVLGCFSITNIDDHKTFSKLDFPQMKTIEKLQQLHDELQQYYIPCKARTYLAYIDDKTSLTILRQFLKTRNRILISQEKFINGKKYSVYHISKIFLKNYKPLYPEFQDDSITTSYTLKFD